MIARPPLRSLRSLYSLRPMPDPLHCILAQATRRAPTASARHWHFWTTIGELALAAGIGLLVHLVLSTIGRRVLGRRGANERCLR